MEVKAKLNCVYAPSENVVAREVQKEFVIIPITSGIGDLEDEMFTLNDTGRVIWNKLDGKSSLKEIAGFLVAEFEGSNKEIETDILGLAQELLKRRIIVEIKRG